MFANQYVSVFACLTEDSPSFFTLKSTPLQRILRPEGILGLPIKLHRFCLCDGMLNLYDLQIKTFELKHFIVEPSNTKIFRILVLFFLSGVAIQTSVCCFSVSKPSSYWRANATIGFWVSQLEHIHDFNAIVQIKVRWVHPIIIVSQSQRSHHHHLHLPHARSEIFYRQDVELNLLNGIC